MTEASEEQDPARKLACMLGQHYWIVDPEDIRYRECLFCETLQYIGKEFKRGRSDRRTREAE